MYDLRVLVRVTARATMPVKQMMLHQYGVTMHTHANEQTAARMAEIVCTLPSRSELKKAGAVPTNAIDAGARKARN